MPEPVRCTDCFGAVRPAQAADGRPEFICDRCKLAMSPREARDAAQRQERAAAGGGGTEGPRFSITTWRDGEGWHARLVPIRPEAAPFADACDERKGCVGHGRRMLETAVRDAVSHYLRTWGKP